MKLTEDWFKNQLERWKTGEWCHECQAPQYVLPGGKHDCASLPEIRERLEKGYAALKQVDHYLNIISTQKDISDKSAAFKLAKETIRTILDEQFRV